MPGRGPGPALPSSPPSRPQPQTASVGENLPYGFEQEDGLPAGFFRKGLAHATSPAGRYCSPGGDAPAPAVRRSRCGAQGVCGGCGRACAPERRLPGYDPADSGPALPMVIYAGRCPECPPGAHPHRPADGGCLPPSVHRPSAGRRAGCYEDDRAPRVRVFAPWCHRGFLPWATRGQARSAGLGGSVGAAHVLEGGGQTQPSANG